MRINKQPGMSLSVFSFLYPGLKGPTGASSNRIVWRLARSRIICLVLRSVNYTLQTVDHTIGMVNYIFTNTNYTLHCIAHTRQSVDYTLQMVILHFKESIIYFNTNHIFQLQSILKQDQSLSNVKWQHINATFNFDYTAIVYRLRAVSWSNDSDLTCVVKQVNRIPTFPLSTTVL